MATPVKSGLGFRRRPQQTRAAILQAAIQEFAHHGIAGARTDAIARSAGVNKALLYYYFKDKQTLYGAAMDHAFRQLSPDENGDRLGPAIAGAHRGSSRCCAGFRFRRLVS